MTRLIALTFGFALLLVASLSLAATQNAVLTWTDLTNETSYTIERKVGPTGTYAQVGTVLAGVTTFTDVNLVQGTNYCWHVFGVNGVGSGVPSDDACITTAGIPNKVGGLNVTITLVP